MYLQAHYIHHICSLKYARSICHYALCIVWREHIHHMVSKWAYTNEPVQTTITTYRYSFIRMKIYEKACISTCTCFKTFLIVADILWSLVFVSTSINLPNNSLCIFSSSIASKNCVVIYAERRQTKGQSLMIIY